VPFLLWLIAFGLLFVAGTAEAAISQSDTTTESAFMNDTSLMVNQRLGTGLTGSMGTTSVRIKVNSTNNSNTNSIVIAIYESTNSGYTSFGNSYGGSGACVIAPTLGVERWYTCNITGTYNASRYYQLVVTLSGAGSPEADGYAYGSSNAASYANGEATTTTPYFGGTHGPYLPIRDFAFYIGATPPPDDTSTRLEDYQPIGTTTATTTVTVSTKYYINSFEYPELGGQTWEVCLTGGDMEGGPIIMPDGTTPNRTYEYCVDAVPDALNTISTTTVLQSGAWQAYAVIRNASTTATLIAKPYRFVIGSSNIITTWETPAGTASSTGSAATFCQTAASTEAGGLLDWTLQKFVEALRIPICWAIDGFQGIMIYLFYPSNESVEQFGTLTLDNRFPFEYLYQTYDMFEDMFGSDNAETPEFVVPTPFGDMTFLSDAQIDAWAPITVPLRLAILGVLWWLTVMYVYHRLLKSHDR